ncbi:unnamed protein product, partial [Amoebophrya sp. A25]
PNDPLFQRSALGSGAKPPGRGSSSVFNTYTNNFVLSNGGVPPVPTYYSCDTSHQREPVSPTSISAHYSSDASLRMFPIVMYNCTGQAMTTQPMTMPPSAGQTPESSSMPDQQWQPAMSNFKKLY